jgi:hypothetical protein
MDAAPFPIFKRFGLPPEQIEECVENIKSQIPLGRIGQSEEVAKTALFLASSDSSFILAGIRFSEKDSRLLFDFQRWKKKQEESICAKFNRVTIDVDYFCRGEIIITKSSDEKTD